MIYENRNLSFILMPEGRIVPDSAGNTYAYEYFIKDHLGNTRAIIDHSSQILEHTDYYPFGMPIAALSYSTTEPQNKYLYNGKELQDAYNLDWLEYGARMYDAQICRFPSLDPKADQFAYVSPYNYAENRPIDGIDLWGLQFTGANERLMFFSDPQNYSKYKENQRKGLQEVSSLGTKAANKISNLLGNSYVAGPIGMTCGITSMVSGAAKFSNIATLPIGFIEFSYGASLFALSTIKLTDKIVADAKGRKENDIPSGPAALAGKTIDKATDNDGKTYENMGNIADVVISLTSVGNPFAKNITPLTRFEKASNNASVIISIPEVAKTILPKADENQKK